MQWIAYHRAYASQIHSVGTMFASELHVRTGLLQPCPVSVGAADKLQLALSLDMNCCNEKKERRNTTHTQHTCSMVQVCEFYKLLANQISLLNAENLDLLVCPGLQLEPKMGCHCFLCAESAGWDRAGKNLNIYRSTSCLSCNLRF